MTTDLAQSSVVNYVAGGILTDAESKVQLETGRWMSKRREVTCPLRPVNQDPHRNSSELCERDEGLTGSDKALEDREA